MVGILLALQIDNWNEVRKNRHEEAAYLQRFTNDLKQDTAYLNSKIRDARLAQESFLHFIQALPQPQDSHLEVISLLNSANWGVEELILQDYTFLEASNTGKFGLIKNPEVREM